jgi:hypothetical protein
MPIPGGTRFATRLAGSDPKGKEILAIFPCRSGGVAWLVAFQEELEFNRDGWLVVHLKAIGRVCHYDTKALLAAEGLEHQGTERTVFILLRNLEWSRCGDYLTPFSGFQTPCNFRTYSIWPMW